MLGDVPPTARDTVIVAFHAVEALACLRENELVDALLAASASEAFGMEGVITGHDRLVQNRPLADLAIVTIRADGRAIREQK